MTQTTLSNALAHARTLPPPLAERQAAEILRAVPGHPEALLILAAAFRQQGKLAEAADILRKLAITQPNAASVHFEWARTQADIGDIAPAIASLRHALALKPALTGGWRYLGDLLNARGDLQAASAAYAQHVEAAVHDPALMQAARALVDNDLPKAEALLRAHLTHYPTDVAALRMLAEAGTRLGRDANAQSLLEICLKLHPGFKLAQHNLAVVLFRQNRHAEALPHIEHLRAEDPADPIFRSLHAACFAMLGAYGAAIDIYENLLAELPNLPKIWLSYGHALKTVGRRADSIAAYRRAIAQTPSLGEAYWSLANMKSLALTSSEENAIRQQLAGPTLTAEDRYHLHYTLGHVLELRRDYAASWSHYAEGARIRRGEITYDADRTTAQVDRTRRLMTRDFFADRKGLGCTDESPIFIVGLPRSGSTLLEQILASHSQVEGTMELPELARLSHELGQGRDYTYPEMLAGLTPATLKDLGARYLERTRIYRQTQKPIFIDKMPNNFVHAGLIHLILPRAIIIDARRHPMAACFSAFKQHFAKGQHYSYDLTELARYYNDYRALMAHFDETLPGRIYRVQYEYMVENTEEQTKRLLDHCSLDFEDACLRFHENARAVRTASSEQVRRPIFRDSLQHWKKYETWLEPLRQALNKIGGTVPVPPNPPSLL
jgi:tetratricopeptide (TPR) repeat protein